MSAAPDDFDKVRDLATPADEDLLDKIVQLEKLAGLRRPNKTLEDRYTRLRAEVTAVLSADGPRWYLDENGTKRFAYAVNPQEVVVDIEEVLELAAEGMLPRLDVEKVFPRRTDPEELRKALARGAIPRPVVTKHVHLVPKTSYTKFADDAREQD